MVSVSSRQLRHAASRRPIQLFEAKYLPRDWRGERHFGLTFHGRKYGSVQLPLPSVPVTRPDLLPTTRGGRPNSLQNPGQKCLRVEGDTSINYLPKVVGMVTM